MEVVTSLCSFVTAKIRKMTVMVILALADELQGTAEVESNTRRLQLQICWYAFFAATRVLQANYMHMNPH